MKKEEIKFQKEVVQMIDEKLRVIDDLACDESIEKAIKELKDAFYIKRYSFDNYGEIREIILEYKKRIGHTHEVMYSFSDDEFTFNFFGRPELHEVRLDYSEEIMENLVEEFKERFQWM